MPLPLAVPLILGGLQTGAGILQKSAASRRRKEALANLKNEIPSGITEQVQMARGRASRTGLPGEDKTRARLESNIAEGVAKGESVAGSSSDVLGLYSNLYGRKMDINQQLLEKGAQYKSENELQLQKTLGLLGEAENQQFYYNRMVPFLSEMGYAGDQAAGGSANIAGGLQTAYSGWMNNFMADQYNGMNTGGQGAPSQGGAGGTMPSFESPYNAPTGVTAPTNELNKWVDPRDQYNIGHPNREQMTPDNPGAINNYGNNYPAY